MSERLYAYGKNQTSSQDLDVRLKALTDWRMGKLRGEQSKGPRTVGQLPEQYRYGEHGVFQATYIVYSYDTPIAWVVDGEWVQPDVEYSQTTSKQQASISVAVSVLSETE